MKINVLIAHRTPIIQAGLLAILAEQDDIIIVSPLSSRADVVITDYDGLVASAQPWCCPVILVMPHSGEREVRAAARHGAHGYVTQTCALQELLDGVRALAQGRSFFQGTAAQTLAELLRPCELTKREHDVLALLAEGMSNKEIARNLDIGIGTVKSHLKSVMHKLDARCRTQAVVLAVQRGLVLTNHVRD